MGSAEKMISKIRQKIEEEWEKAPYHYQLFNAEESSCPYPSYCHRSIVEEYVLIFNQSCEKYKSFDFSIEPPSVVEAVNPCSYSELETFTCFIPENVIHETLSGRLFRGIIGEGSETPRPAVVKTWDLLLPLRRDLHDRRPLQFCDEIELFTDEKTNTHPRLAKLHTYCYEKRLAAVYEGLFTKFLSDVLLDVNFGWDKRGKVAIQLAELLAWLHDKGTAVGVVTGSCIKIDEDANIEVFDFGYVSNHVNKDSKIPLKISVGCDAPEVGFGMRTMKSDVYPFGVLLLQLVTKREFDLTCSPVDLKCSIRDVAENGKNLLVHECFKEVDYMTALRVTNLIKLCLKIDPEERPTMEDVLDQLRALWNGDRGGKRKRDENEAEQSKGVSC